MEPERNSEFEAKSLLERPLAARSLIASLLLRSRPSRMRGARLVQWCALFGVADGTTRVALSRMVERGELRSRDGMYELAGRVRGRGDAQDWSLDPVVQAWDGSWRLAIVTPGPREAQDRTSLRTAMRRLRFAELRESVWTRPDNVPRRSAPAESWAVADAQCAWWSGAPAPDAVAGVIARFDGPGWSDRAVMLTHRLRHVTEALGAPDDRALAHGFVAGAASVAHLRADPFLPAELAADPAAGVALREAYRAYEITFSSALHGWFSKR